MTEISGGERQLALIARALAQDAGILILDEPTANLDFGNKLRVLREIERLRGQGRAIVFSTHDPDQALGACGPRAAAGARRRARAGAGRRGAHRRRTGTQLYGVAVQVIEVAGVRRAFPVNR